VRLALVRAWRVVRQLLTESPLLALLARASASPLPSGASTGS
jgi:hypothetical protein